MYKNRITNLIPKSQNRRKGGSQHLDIWRLPWRGGGGGRGQSAAVGVSAVWWGRSCLQGRHSHLRKSIDQFIFGATKFISFRRNKINYTDALLLLVWPKCVVISVARYPDVVEGGLGDNLQQWVSRRSAEDVHAFKVVIQISANISIDYFWRKEIYQTDYY